MLFRSISILSLLFLVSCSSVGVGTTETASDKNKEDYAGHHMEAFKGSSALEIMKSLNGTWKGTVNTPEGGEENTTVTYQVTSNGSAVVETIFVGTPMEMTSVYYDKAGKMMMTHYCSLGNRPTMILDSDEDYIINMVYHSGEDLDPSKSHHIHGVKITIHEDGSIEQNWQGYEGGKPSNETIVKLKRFIEN